MKKFINIHWGMKKLLMRIVADENVNINHMILGNGECLPEHYSNSNVYMSVVARALLRCSLTIRKKKLLAQAV